MAEECFNADFYNIQNQMLPEPGVHTVELKSKYFNSDEVKKRRRGSGFTSKEYLFGNLALLKEMIELLDKDNIDELKPRMDKMLIGALSWKSTVIDMEDL